MVPNDADTSDHENDTETHDGDAEALPVARPKREAHAPNESAFGIVAPEVRTWTCSRLGDTGHAEKLMSPNSRGTEVGEWPIHELSEEEIARRWGAGMYTVRWFGAHPSTGARHPRGGSKPFRITQDLVDRVRPPPPPAPAAAPPVPGLPAHMAETFALMGFLDQQSDRKLNGIVQAATLLGSRGGDSSQTLEIVP